MGETFSGVDFATGVQAAREFAALVPDGITAAQAALAWIAQLPQVSTVIPGARDPEQARANAEAGALRRPRRRLPARHPRDLRPPLPGRRALPLVVGYKRGPRQQREERRRAATTRSRRLG